MGQSSSGEDVCFFLGSRKQLPGTCTSPVRDDQYENRFGERWDAMSFPCPFVVCGGTIRDHLVGPLVTRQKRMRSWLMA